MLKKILISFLIVIYLKTEGIYILSDHIDRPWMLSTMFLAYRPLHMLGILVSGVPQTSNFVIWVLDHRF